MRIASKCEFRLAKETEVLITPGKCIMCGYKYAHYDPSLFSGHNFIVRFV